MTATAEGSALQALWNNRVRWSRAADAMKQRIDRPRVAALWLSSIGAVATAGSATLSAHQHGAAAQIAAGVGAVALAIATFLTALYLTAETTRRWVRARAVSEDIKQQFYRFSAGAKPYTGDDRLRQLQDEVAEITLGAADLEPYLPELTGPAGSPPPPLTPDDYVRQRVENQITEYYRPKARHYADRSRRLRILVVALSAVAAVAAVITATPAVPGGVAPWAAVFTTLGGALAVYATARRYDFLVVSYSATANRLQHKLDRWRSDGAPSDAAAWSAFVDDCENVIAQQNESWLAKWSESKVG